MATALVQPSFAAGELSPQTQGRVDLAKYRIGCATLRNFMVLPQGGAVNRPGTRFIAECISSGAGLPSRLIPFQFNQTQTYVLEFGHNAMRVIMNGGIVQASGGGDYVLSTPYASTEVRALNYTQSADTMTIVHRSHPVMELTRTAHNAWTLTAATFSPTIGRPTGVTAAAIGYDPSLGAFAWSYRVTALSSSGSEESLPSDIATTVNNGSLDASKNKVNNVSWSAVSGASGYVIYKDSGGLYGFIGETTGSTSFQDRNISPDTTKSIQQFRDPMSFSFPGVVEYHQQRRIFASSYDQPQTLWATQSGNIRNFDVSEPIRDSDAITATLSVRQVNEIRGLVSLGSLLVFTSGAEFICDGDQQGILTPASTTFKPQSYIGSSPRPPLIAGADVLYERSRGSGVSTIRYDFAASRYDPIDLSVLSSHLLVGYWLEEWAWAQEPYRVAWMCRNDGELLGLTYMREQDVYAWHHHDTDGSWVSVASIIIGNEDVPHFVTQRTINGVIRYYIEQMQSRVQGQWFVDCGLSYSGGAVTTLGGLNHLEGKTVVIVSDGALIGVAPVSGGSITLPRACTNAIVGLQYLSDLETLNVEGGQTTIQGKLKKISAVTVRVQNTQGIQVGPDVNHLTPVMRDPRGANISGTLFTGDVRIIQDSTWEPGGRVFIRQPSPLPCSVLDVIPELSVGG